MKVELRLGRVSDVATVAGVFHGRRVLRILIGRFVSGQLLEIGWLAIRRDCCDLINIRLATHFGGEDQDRGATTPGWCIVLRLVAGDLECLAGTYLEDIDVIWSSSIGLVREHRAIG